MTARTQGAVSSNCAGSKLNTSLHRRFILGHCPARIFKSWFWFSLPSARRLAREAEPATCCLQLRHLSTLKSTSPASQTPGHHSLLISCLPTNITFSCLTVLEEGTACAQLLFPHLCTVHQGRGASSLSVRSREWHLIWVSNVPQIHGPNILHWEH